MRRMPSNEAIYERYRTAGFHDTSLETTREGYAPYQRWLPGDRRARIVDLGCGGGEFLHFLTELGYESVRGVDFSVEQVQRCRERGLSAEQVMDTAAWIAEQRGSLDCVVL